MTTIRLGNASPIEHLHVPDESPDAEEGATTRVRKAVDIPEGDDHAVTEFRTPDGMPLVDVLVAVTAPGTGAWDNHSDAPPVWVSSDDDDVARLLSKHFTTDEHACDVVPFGDDTPVGVTPPGEPAAADDEQPKAKRRSH